MVACSGDTTAPDSTPYRAPSALADFKVVPSRVTIETNQQIRFRGERRDHRRRELLPHSISWESSGGAIDSSGSFSAVSAGTYKIIGRGRGRQKSDTSTVVVVPPPTDLIAVSVTPDSVTLSSSSTYTFAANGLLSDGTTAPIGVTWEASGGSIDAGGLYTAGATPGTYAVIAIKTGATLADTARVVIPEPPAAAPPPSSVPTAGVGIPFGPSQMPTSVSSPLFTLRHEAVSASNIVSRIDAARQGHFELLLNMTGGDHDNYMSVIDGIYQFDPAKWRAKMNTFNTSAIRQAVASAVTDGVLVGNSVMDEPQVCGAGDGNTWGPCGTMTKIRVDSLCGYAKAMFPGLPVGVAHNHTAFEPTKDYRVCEFDITQYASRLGDPVDFRNSALAIAERSGTKVVFSINLLNGGVQDKDGTWDCTGPGQAGKGTYSPNCRMTPAQVEQYSLILGPAGCSFKMWRYDEEFMADAANGQAFRDVAAKLATLPRVSCARLAR